MNYIFSLYYLLTITVILLFANLNSADKDDVYRNVGQTRNFTGKVVLVTGSTSGIGEGIVKLFSHFGAHVVITGRNATELKRVTTETQALSPLKLQPLAVLADVTKSNDLSGLLNETIKQFGKLDVLVNNAGAGTYTSARAPDFMKVFDRAILLNLRSYAELSHLAIPYLDATNGTIISISSISSMVPTPLGLPYEVAKIGVDMMGRTLAMELGPKIRVNTINPGLILTNFMGHSTPNGTDPHDITKLLKEVIERTPLKRPGQPIDIANAVTYLASSEASFVTSANLVVDGGLVYNAGGLTPQ